MRRQLALPLAAAAAVVYACGGPHPHAASAPADGRAEADSAVAAGVVVATATVPAARSAPAHRSAHGHAAADTASVQTSLAIAMAEEVTFALRVVNVSEHRLEVNFPDGQTREFAVYDEAGREVWRWSRGRLFTQVMQNKLLHAGDTATYESAWKRPVPGRYHVVATLRSENHPVRLEAPFVVAPRAGDAAIPAVAGQVARR